MSFASYKSGAQIPRFFILLMMVGVAGCASDRQTAVREQSPAEADFEAGAKRPPTPKTLFAMAQILATQGKDTEAEFVLCKILNEHPDFLPAYSELASLQMRARRIEQAERVLRAGLRHAPQDAVLLNDLGMCQLVNGEFNDALRTFTQASGFAPDQAKYRANMATALGMMGRYEEAISLYQEIMSPADAHYNVAVLCDARHDFERADEEYKRSVALGGSARARAADVSTGAPNATSVPHGTGDSVPPN